MYPNSLSLALKNLVATWAKAFQPCILYLEFNSVCNANLPDVRIRAGACMLDLCSSILSSVETEIIESRNGTVDLCLLPNLAESYQEKKYFQAKIPGKSQNFGLTLKTKNFCFPKIVNLDKIYFLTSKGSLFDASQIWKIWKSQLLLCTSLIISVSSLVPTVGANILDLQNLFCTKN